MKGSPVRIWASALGSCPPSFALCDDAKGGSPTPFRACPQGTGGPTRRNCPVLHRRAVSHESSDSLASIEGFPVRIWASALLFRPHPLGLVASGPSWRALRLTLPTMSHEGGTLSGLGAAKPSDG